MDRRWVHHAEIALACRQVFRRLLPPQGWNAAKQLQGFVNSSLTLTGKEQAASAGAFVAEQYPTLTKVYSSDLKRAADTAAAVASACRLERPTLDSRLREVNLGCVQGQSWVQVQEQLDPAVDAFHQDCRVPIPGGESNVAKYARITAALADIARAHAGETVAVVAHGGVVRDIQRAALGKPLHQHITGRIPNACISEFSLEPHAEPKCMPVKDPVTYSDVVPHGVAMCRQAYAARGHVQPTDTGNARVHGVDVLAPTPDLEAVVIPLSAEQMTAEGGGSEAGAAVVEHSALARLGAFTCVSFGLTKHLVTVT